MPIENFPAFLSLTSVSPTIPSSLSHISLSGLPIRGYASIQDYGKQSIPDKGQELQWYCRYVGAFSEYHTVYFLPEQRKITVCRIKQPCQHFHQCGLTCAVLTDKAVYMLILRLMLTSSRARKLPYFTDIPCVCRIMFSILQPSFHYPNVRLISSRSLCVSTQFSTYPQSQQT